MTRSVLHLFHADPASMKTVPALAERIHQDRAGALESAAAAFPRYAGEGATVIVF